MQAENRKIIHVDMDAFYASVEQRDDPSLRGRPVVVGGSPEQRGVVAACSYEARKFGIHSAMPSARAKQLCPQVAFLRPRFDVYRSVSAQVFAVLRAVTDRVEPMSLDEGYLDVTGVPGPDGSATGIARVLKTDIRAATGLTASAGVSYNKFLAKLASDMDKPDGLFVIRPETAEGIIDGLPVRRFHGIGPATEARMHALNIRTGSDLRQFSREFLVSRFGKSGDYYYDISRGIDHREVRASRPRKSLSSETTFVHDLVDRDRMLQQLHGLAEEVMQGLQQRELAARTITLKVRYNDFRIVTRSCSRDDGWELPSLLEVLPELLAKTEAGQKPVRLLGVGASGLSRHKPGATGQQFELFTGAAPGPASAR